MILTESQACKRLCPMINETCRGSGCMAWREVIKGSRSETNRFKTPLVGQEATDAQNTRCKQIKITEAYIIWEETIGKDREGTGYCGLAGNPAESNSFKQISGPSRIIETEEKIVKNERGETFDLEEIKRLSGM